jgi:hypothetical protein
MMASELTRNEKVVSSILTGGSTKHLGATHTVR